VDVQFGIIEAGESMTPAVPLGPVFLAIGTRNKA
jgi:hypothetical protein